MLALSDLRKFAKVELWDTKKLAQSEEMKNLQDEVSSLKGKLALIAEKEFNAQRLKVAKKLGCSVEDIKTPEDLKRAKETARRIEQQGEGSGQSTLSYSEAIGEDNASDMSIDVPLQWRSYDSYEDLVNSLKKIAENPEHEDHKEAQTYLKALTKKAMRQKHSQVELEGNLKDALRKRQNKKKRAKFRKVK